uniref:Uncharacterized protein n=2 Tax=Setaria viridis TaxID=4556 RepID=A0A4U6UKF9_SETVI|nr:hypothetical protein SEVIR_5G163333v2 [Setaria viridis]
MDVELSPVCTQLHEDVTIDHVVPPIVAKGNTATASPDTDPLYSIGTGRRCSVLLPSADASQDVNMNDGHSAQNVRSEHVFGATLIQHNQIENDMSSGGKNQELNQGVPEGFQQNRTEEQDLPPFEALHDSIAYHNDNVDLDNIMEDDLSPVHTDVTIDHIVPHALAKGDSVAASPNGRIEIIADDALSPILLQHCTQDDIIHRPAIALRPRRLSKRPPRCVSPFKGDPERAKAPQLTAHAVRKKIPH